MRAPSSVIKQQFLKKWIMGLQVFGSAKQNMSILERKKAIRLSADIALASTRDGRTCWSRALIANASKEDDSKVLVQHLLAPESERLKKASTGLVMDNKRLNYEELASNIALCIVLLFFFVLTMFLLFIFLFMVGCAQYANKVKGTRDILSIVTYNDILPYEVLLKQLAVRFICAYFGQGGRNTWYYLYSFSYDCIRTKATSQRPGSKWFVCGTLPLLPDSTDSPTARLIPAGRHLGVLRLSPKFRSEFDTILPFYLEDIEPALNFARQKQNNLRPITLT
ncbi:hypothetical protein D5086_013236 [Populus alba]|uniref:Uncharacterized protein n=1 Tax=Populus alba TaxID=43335 RepID=A0ACC4C4D4_POPAL